MEERRGGRPRPPQATLNWRLYRLCLAPVLAAVLICAFSLSSPPAPLSSTLTPEAFEGSHAYGQLTQMEALAPDGRRLLEYLHTQLSGLGSPASGGYSLSVADAGTPQALLIAQRAGTGTRAPIALLASRGPRAQLSGAAALLEIASVLAQGETRHPIYLIWAAGGSDGDQASGNWLQSRLGGNLDAAIALGNLAAAKPERPLVQPFSTAFGLAPELLTNTVSFALKATMGWVPGTSSLASQLAHLALPVSVGAQGPLNAIGIPSVSVSLTGERPAARREAVSQAHLQAAGRGVLSAFYAIDRAGEIGAAQTSGLRLSGRVLSQWSIALLTLTLLIGPLALSGDALVRRTRRRRGAARRLLLTPLLWALPFALGAASLRLLSLAGLLRATPNPLGAAALHFGLRAALTLTLALAVLGGCSWALRKLALPASAPAALLIGCLLAFVVWLIDPYATLLLIPALHAWPLASSQRDRPRQIALLLIPALAPLALLIAFYALWLGLGPAQILLEGMVMVGGGYVSIGGVLLWSLALGVFVTIASAPLGRRASQAPRVSPPPEDRVPVPHLRRVPVYRERVLR
jgi:hypothetical protein